MGKYQVGLIITLLCLSVVILFVPAVIFCVRRINTKASRCTRKRSGLSRMFVFSACLIGAVWCLRYAVGYFAIISSDADLITLTWWEEIFNSMVHALQTFSMDEEYTEYIINGKLMLSEICGADSVWPAVYGVYTSVLNFIAPIAGGAIIFEMIASIFPKVKLHLSQLAFWKEKYYFSELNEASLALAKSIRSERFFSFKRPVIIFTDAYVDDKDEKGSEIFLEAKLLGAICIRDDLSHIRKNKFGRKSFFLIDEDESGNLQTLAELSNSDNSIYLKKSEIFLFTNEDAYVQVEKRLHNKLSSDLNFADEELPVFIPVQSYRNMISNLLVDIPLYEPLTGKKRNADDTQDLVVTIFGTGDIGKEMFLSAYWFGQILNCNLKINVLSEETEAEFWSRIDYVNPEIKHTTIEGDPILRINRKGDMAKVYCDVEYYQCNVKSSEFISYLTNHDKHILNTDYFFVSLGSDENNISVANTVRQYIGQYRIMTNSPSRTVITYVVYNPELSKILNRKKFFNFVNDKIDVFMQAVGSLHDVYSVRNVFLTEHNPFAQKVHESYMAVQHRKQRADTHKKRMNDDYNHWANLARAMHNQYKVYSMGMINISLFDYPNSQEAYREELKKIYDEYKQKISGQNELKSDDLTLLHKMAWLEHRRWNAFTRVKGFRSTTDYDRYAVRGVMGSYKQMDLKLHPCLVECDQRGIRADISSKGVIDKNSLFQCSDHADFDLLDDLSYDLHEKQYNDYDFKQYDYPITYFN
ncbi:MAG TPA: hypothetical protein GXZ43_06215 [Clostridiaceae bacterium]|nr:hypothetical protein [Clostridiaceae bacterium]